MEIAVTAVETASVLVVTAGETGEPNAARADVMLARLSCWCETVAWVAITAVSLCADLCFCAGPKFGFVQKAMEVTARALLRDLAAFSRMVRGILDWPS